MNLQINEEYNFEQNADDSTQINCSAGLKITNDLESQSMQNIYKSNAKKNKENDFNLDLEFEKAYKYYYNGLKP